MISRRQFVSILSAGALTARLKAYAQPVKVPRIGFLEPGAQDSGLTSAFIGGMQDLGYIDGKTMIIDARFANGEIDRLGTLAAELAALKPDIMVAQSTPGVRAVLQAKSTAPLVMVAVGDPLGSGFVTNLGRPGGNVTGISILTSDISPKLLEMLHIMLPKITRVSVLVNPANSNSTVSLKNVIAAAQRMNLQISSVQASGRNDLERAFSEMSRQHPGAVLIPGDALFRLHARTIAQLGLKHKLPLAVTNVEIVETGGLLSYGASMADTYRRAAVYVDKILKGARAGDLPVEQSAKFETVINRRGAAALGLTIPGELMLRADRVIE